jgi:putative ABC transport system ATP-binding protein
MLCDEPTGALDTDMGSQILQLLKGVTTDSHRTVLTVTHNSVIAEMADRVIELRDGVIVGERVNRSPVDPADLTW